MTTPHILTLEQLAVIYSRVLAHRAQLERAAEIQRSAFRRKDIEL